MILPLHTLCTSAASRARWELVRTLHDDLRIVLHEQPRDYAQFLNTVIESGHSVIGVCHEDVVVGKSFGRRALKLAGHLDSKARSFWGIAGNKGVSADGSDIYSFSNFTLDRSVAPIATLLLGPDVLLLNLDNLRAAGLRLPEGGGLSGANILLSAECCRLGLASFVDSHLFTVRPKPENISETLAFIRGELFGTYWAKYFFNHILHTEHGPLDLSKWVDYSYLDYGAPRTGRADIVDKWRAVQDKLCASVQPTLTIVCRTMLKRQAMLSRAIQSFATAACRVKYLKVNAVLATTQPAAGLMRTTVARLQRLAPALSLRGEVVALGSRFSRTELMYRYLTKSNTDYVWFVDDDDFVFADALRHLENAINLDKGNLLIGNSIVFNEAWASNDDPQFGRMLTFERHSEYSARNFLQCLSGRNNIPLCSVVFPVSLMKQRLAGVSAEGDYYEDYFFLCHALSSPSLDVRVVNRALAGISLHNFGNTVTEIDRTHWDFSYATFFGEFINLRTTANGVFWTLAARHGTPANDSQPGK